MASAPPTSSSAKQAAPSKASPLPPPIGVSTTSELPTIPRTLELTQAVSRPAALTLVGCERPVRRPGPLPDNLLTFATTDRESFITEAE